MALLLVLLLSGCLWKPATSVKRIPPGELLATLGSSARAPFATEVVPEAPTVAWRKTLERGIQSAPLVHDDLLVLGVTGRAAVTASARTGSRYWTRRFNGPVIGATLRVGNELIIGTASRDGRIQALSIERGRERWETRLRSPITADPVAGEGRVYAATARGELHALDVASGVVAWRIRTPGVIQTAPVLHERVLLAATAHDTLMRVNAHDGSVLATAMLPGTPSAPLALAGDRLLVAVHPDAVASYDAATLRLVRIDTVGSPVLAAPVVDRDGAAYVLTRDAEVWRLDANGARRLAQLGGAARESLTLAANGLLVGRLDGTLFLLRKDGTPVWQRAYGSSLRAPVTVAQGALYVGLLNGQLEKLQ